MPYFILEADPSTSVMALFKEENPGHDLKWLFGEPMLIDTPRITSIIIDDEYNHDEHDHGTITSLKRGGKVYPDFFDLMRAPIGSERFKTALEHVGVDNVEFFPTIIEEPLGRRLKGHYAVNVVGRVACVDSERSALSKTSTQIIRIRSLILREKDIAGAKLFRLHEYPEIIVVTEDVASAIRSLSGVLLSPATGWNDAHRF